MLKWRVKYAIVSTYKETVFLKIDRAHSDPSRWGVYYSRGIINSSDKATLDHTGKVTTVSTRLMTLYMLHRVSHSIKDSWRLTDDDMKSTKSDFWVSRQFGTATTEEVTPYQDHVINVLVPQAANLNLGSPTPPTTRQVSSRDQHEEGASDDKSEDDEEDSSLSNDSDENDHTFNGGPVNGQNSAPDSTIRTRLRAAGQPSHTK
jgi:hypothetical protein